MTKVPLSRKYTVNDKTFDHITLREPTFKETHMAGLGVPQEMQPGPRGSTMLVTYPEVVDAYAQRLVVEPGYEYIADISAVDAMALQQEICGFFLHSPQSATPQTGSPST
ncbi:phage tail assembly protein [Agrobacterium rosae]|uniref:phage tail assembly protein n=1 Tax=Agrobacterium rosae TaxID=1972867 RepID=UPI003B9EDC76